LSHRLEQFGWRLFLQQHNESVVVVLIKHSGGDESAEAEAATGLAIDAYTHGGSITT
jgi:hypothetical protein